MTLWGRSLYGDPCDGCGFLWSITLERAMAAVSDTPDELARLLRPGDGVRRRPGLAWPVVSYVCHIGDNLRIWAERLAGLSLGDMGPVGRYDQDQLAEGRRYDEVSLAGAMWSLRRAVGDWTDAIPMANDADVVLVHPDRGAQSVLDVATSNAHDCHHHVHDIATIIGATDEDQT
jgi:hypothetical protein